MLRRISLIFLGLIVSTLLVAGWYAYNRGFTQKWRKFVVEEFHKRGVELSLSRLTLEPFRGIIAKKVRIYENRDRKRVIAVVDEVRLVINYANLFQGRTFIDALDLRDANLDIPLDPSKRSGPKLEIRRLSGLLYLPPQQIYLSRLEAEIYGIDLRASGRLINPQKSNFLKVGGAQQTRDRARIAASIIDELKRFRYEGSPPQLDLRFSGDLANPDELFIEATLWAERVRREGSRIDNLFANGNLRDGIARLRQLTANDAGGAIRAGGSYDTATRTASLELQSGLDAQGLIRSYFRIAALDEAVFYAQPRIDLHVRASFAGEPSFQAIGHVELKKFAWKSVIFDALTTDFSWDGERWSALGTQLLHRTGRITGDVLNVQGDYRSSLKSTIPRKNLAPLFAGNAGERMPPIEFIESVQTDEPGPPVVIGTTR